MQFKIGDQVMHASQGNGQILAIEEKQFAGSETKLFYAVAINKGTVWVPVDSGNSPSLRLLVSNSALGNCRALLKSRPVGLNINRRQRVIDLNNRLQKSSFETLCEVIRDLSAYGWPKPLSESDTSTLRRIREAVGREWATAAGISQVDALKEISLLLQEGHQTYAVS